MSLRIYTYPNSYRTQKALIAAQYCGVTIELPEFKLGEDNKKDWFKALNPLQKVPVLQTPNGCVFESNAIARYVARLRPDCGLFGSSFLENALVDQWIDFCQNELEPSRAVWLYQILGYVPNNAKALAEAKKELENTLGVLNSHLLANTFLVGNRVTLADIAVFVALVEPFAKLFSPKFIQPFGNLVRWFQTIANQPEVAKVIGKVEFAKEEAQPAKADKKKEEAKPAEKKKEEPKPAAAASAGGDEEDEDGVPRPKKAKSALDLLPESPMGHLDTWKKLMFAKKPLNPAFWDEIWPKWDAAGFSWFLADYQYNAENTVYFKTGNLVGGFIQRCDAVRPYALGVMNMSGNPDEETPPFYVSGAWLFRGTEVPKEMKEENPDSEYYTWTKVDVSTEEGKKKIRQQFEADDMPNGKCLDRRFFK